MQLGMDEGEGLDKICFAPLRNEFTGPNTVDQCTIQSVWGYLGNDDSILMDDEKYFKKLRTCLK